MGVSNNKVVFNNGVNIPTLGFGTASIGSWQQNDNYVVQVLKDAMACGCRYFDISAVAGNESSLGQAMLESDCNASDLFIATKVWNSDQGFDLALRAFDKSCDRLVDKNHCFGRVIRRFSYP